MEVFYKVTIINVGSQQVLHTEFIRPEKLDRWTKKHILKETWGQVEDFDIIVEETDKEKMEALSYLHKTDWYVLREVDEGIAIPQEIKTKREEAREILETETIEIRGVLGDSLRNK